MDVNYIEVIISKYVFVYSLCCYTLHSHSAVDNISIKLERKSLYAQQALNKITHAKPTTRHLSGGNK